MAAPIRHRFATLARGALALAVLPRDYWRVLAALAGVLSAAVGVWWIYPPAALIGVGVLLIVLAFRG
jgi:hypothetical protein